MPATHTLPRHTLTPAAAAAAATALCPRGIVLRRTQADGTTTLHVRGGYRIQLTEDPDQPGAVLWWVMPAEGETMRVYSGWSTGHLDPDRFQAVRELVDTVERWAGAID